MKLYTILLASLATLAVASPGNDYFGSDADLEDQMSTLSATLHARAAAGGAAKPKPKGSDNGGPATPESKCADCNNCFQGCSAAGFTSRKTAPTEVAQDKLKYLDAN